jgi:hypothetical protein
MLDWAGCWVVGLAGCALKIRPKLAVRVLQRFERLFEFEILSNSKCTQITPNEIQ